MLVERATCPGCGGGYDPLRATAVRVVDGRVRAFCSPACRDRGVPAPPELRIDEPDEEPVRPPRVSNRVMIGSAVAAALALGVGGRFLARTANEASLAAASLTTPIAHASKPPPAAAPTPSEAMAMLSASSDDQPDIWVHPLLGPTRRLPERDTRRFGAAREGMRPEECAGGHCGVDIGTVKGDVVMAAHDGVVERVERDPEVGGRRGNEGRFILINHKGGTVVTSYIHLDGIREDLRPGIPVKAGEAIGTVGDTGVKNSGPHLHFAVGVRATPDGQELYIDPEPLLHLWPLKTHPIASLHRMEPAPRPRAKTALADSPQEQL